MTSSSSQTHWKIVRFTSEYLGASPWVWFALQTWEVPVPHSEDWVLGLYGHSHWHFHGHFQDWCCQHLADPNQPQGSPGVLRLCQLLFLIHCGVLQHHHSPDLPHMQGHPLYLGPWPHQGVQDPQKHPHPGTHLLRIDGFIQPQLLFLFISFLLICHLCCFHLAQALWPTSISNSASVLLFQRLKWVFSF